MNSYICPPQFLASHLKDVREMLTLIVASSLDDAIMLYVGWKMTRVIGERCPVRQNFSGARGIHSSGSRFSLKFCVVWFLDLACMIHNALNRKKCETFS